MFVLSWVVGARADDCGEPPAEPQVWIDPRVDGAVDVPLDARIPSLAAPPATVLLETAAGVPVETLPVRQGFAPVEPLEPHTRYRLTLTGERATLVAEFTTGDQLSRSGAAELTRVELGELDEGGATVCYVPTSTRSVSAELSLPAVDPWTYLWLAVPLDRPWGDSGASGAADYSIVAEASPSAGPATELTLDATTLFVDEPLCLIAVLNTAAGDVVVSDELCSDEGGCGGCDHSRGSPVVGVVLLAALARRRPSPG